MLATSTFTSITSVDDTRLVTLIGVAIGLIEELAAVADQDPDELLARELYKVNKRVHERGTEMYLRKLISHYPLLNEAIH